MSIRSFRKFFGEVKNESKKVSWPERREVTISTIMVFILVSLAAVFFTVVDWASYSLVKMLLNF